MRLIYWTCLAFLMLGLPLTAAAGDIAVGQLIIEKPWSRATPTGAKVGAGYFSLINIGNEADRLVSATSDISERVEFHSMTMTDGIMRMRHLAEPLMLKPRSVITFKPGGFHLMFVGLKQPLKKGQSFNVTLNFEKTGKIDVLFLTSSIGGKSPYPAKIDGQGSFSGSHIGRGN